LISAAGRRAKSKPTLNRGWYIVIRCRPDAACPRLASGADWTRKLSSMADRI